MQMYPTADTHVCIRAGRSMLLDLLQVVKALSAQTLQHCSRLGTIAQHCPQQLYSLQQQTVWTTAAPLVQLAAINQQKMLTEQPRPQQQPERAAAHHDMCGSVTCSHQALSGISEHRLVQSSCRDTCV